MQISDVCRKQRSDKPENVTLSDKQVTKPQPITWWRGGMIHITDKGKRKAEKRDILTVAAESSNGYEGTV